MESTSGGQASSSALVFRYENQSPIPGSLISPLLASALTGNRKWRPCTLRTIRHNKKKKSDKLALRMLAFSPGKERASLQRRSASESKERKTRRGGGRTKTRKRTKRNETKLKPDAASPLAARRARREALRNPATGRPLPTVHCCLSCRPGGHVSHLLIIRDRLFVHSTSAKPSMWATQIT